ncbi:hypothetical protein EC973_003805 [Apophysomyces ossiformis]|uniref:Kinesin motor domain-containing protein n=1 Tax=Apophysomyces ossiformis TaxID=679940 RepID=A0A8H7BZV9_9FUNG|nr:hypothetical protein EC973_003805 [Apophysomyces ossiformis]
MSKDAQTATVQVGKSLRIRPLTERDRVQPRFANMGSNDVLRAHDKTVHVVSQNKLFTFDHVFGPESKQSEIFLGLGQKLIYKFIEGYNVTILAYGQTSSGKTYTMGTAQHSGRFDEEQEGIVPRAMSLLFDLLQQQPDMQPTSPSSSSASSNDLPSFARGLPRSFSRASPSRFKYTVKVSFVEIYNEDLIDLLNSAPPNERPPVTIREDTKGHIYWTGVKEVAVHSTEDVLFYLQQGTQNRATGATDMNEKSSRSHAIFSVTLKQEKFMSSSPGTPQTSRAASPVPSKLQSKHRSMSAMNVRPDSRQLEDGEWVITNSKFHFVDLAGSERLKRTAAEGDRRKEGININAGLLALGNVISALGDPSKRSTHIPYRDSKLTRLLQDSLGGSATTLMIACASPAEHNLAETLNTLQYANRARNIKNKVEKNEAEEWMTTDNTELLRTMIGKLKNEVKVLKSGPSANGISNGEVMASTAEYEQLYQEQCLLIADLQRQVEELDGEATVTRERNRIVEEELKRQSAMNGPNSGLNIVTDSDFEHLVEPVIEQYEKSLSSLESQLAMARAALHHSDIGFKEQQDKLDYCEIKLEEQKQIIMDLHIRLDESLARERKTEEYVSELEGKLKHSAQDAERDQELLQDLRSRILKFKEVDESTDRYIETLQQQVAALLTEKAQLEAKVEAFVSKPSNLTVEGQQIKEKEEEEVEKEGQKTGEDSGTQIKESLPNDRSYQLQLQLEELEEEHQQTLRELESVLGKYQEALEQLREKDNADTSRSEKQKRAQQEERRILYQQIGRLEQNVRALQAQLVNRDLEPQRNDEEAQDCINNLRKELEQTIRQKEEENEAHQAEISFLNESIKQLEYELQTSSERMKIFQQMSDEQKETAEVEKTLEELEIARVETDTSKQPLDNGVKAALLEETMQSLEHVQREYTALQEKYSELKTELDNKGAWTTESLSKPTCLANIHSKFKELFCQYTAQFKRVAAMHERVRSLSDSPIVENAQLIQALEEQLTVQQDTLRMETQNFRSEMKELMAKNRRLEKEIIMLRRRSTVNLASHRLSMASEASSDNDSAESTGIETPPLSGNGGRRQSSSPLAQLRNSAAAMVAEYERNMRSLMSRLLMAEQDAQIHRATVNKLVIKLSDTEKACLSKSQDNGMVSDGEIEELMQRMNAMKLQLELSESRNLEEARQREKIDMTRTMVEECESTKG